MTFGSNYIPVLLNLFGIQRQDLLIFTTTKCYLFYTVLIISDLTIRHTLCYISANFLHIFELNTKFKQTNFYGLAKIIAFSFFFF